MNNKQLKIQRYLDNLNQRGLWQVAYFLLQNEDNKHFVYQQVEDFAVMYPDLK